ncbi:MAG: BlaI/MecI/CopY family transcriptional regulator [Gammaproteobacteria bacterium]
MGRPVTRSKSRFPYPTDAELEILNALWRQGPSTVRQVYEVIGKRNRIGYTTALKLLQIMHTKGLVTRDDSNRAHVYRPALSQEQTQRQLVGKLRQHAFGGSTLELVLQALGSGEPATQEELARIREIIAGLERQ